LKDTNYITHLNGALERFAEDSRLNPTHISLYMALFQCWNSNYFKEEFYVIRDELMSLSKIGSKSTYHRCIKDLDRWKYLRYNPSHNPFKGSKIKMTEFKTSTGQALYLHRTKIETSTGQALVPIIKHIQTIENIKTNKKQKFLKNSIFKKSKNQNSNALNPDHLHAVEKKKYNTPL
jgi:hypothetical protein